MLALHCSSGLGNQMLHYADYLAYQKANPAQECYLETIIYDLDQNGICMYNGYELERIFGIKAPNVSSVFTPEQWKAVVDEVQASHFWADGHWDYGPVLVKAFARQGLEMENLCAARGWPDPEHMPKPNARGLVKAAEKKVLGHYYNRLYNRWVAKKLAAEHVDRSYALPVGKSFLCGADLNFLNRNSGMSFVEAEVRQAFRFPPIVGEDNARIAEVIRATNSVGVHFRRGDGIFTNGEFIENGYYLRAVKYIKKHVDDPDFFIFSLPDDAEWCKQNMHKFGLDPKRDRLHFISWNCAQDSYMDMQLMSLCKHLVFGYSSFAWWAAFLNDCPDKISICPVAWWDTTVTLA